MIKRYSIFDFSGHNQIEFLLWDHTIEIKISSINQFLELSLTDIFTKFKCYFSEILHWNESSLFMIKDSEYFSDISTGIFIWNSLGEKCYPLFEVNGSISITVQISDHLENSITFALET